MTSARDMFKELGYEVADGKANCIVSSEYWDIIFGKNSRTIKFYNGGIITISTKELKGINKMVEELGWIE